MEVEDQATNPPPASHSSLADTEELHFDEEDHSLLRRRSEASNTPIGASSGIGNETARVLALRGVHVIMAVRNMAAGKDVKEAIVEEIPSAKVDAMELDLSSMASVRKFASDFNTKGLPLNLLM
ncbi:hypothetical protein LWI29_014996 [Acer saccharum]|uniref:Short-chain dehydrogenase/reductase n=1 Tax=Acer saccharum TaxID=4024 RepID=A0AA39VZ25_ACESA|nr:hypothetical protein LWI29_014996 [Acer saccharum]